ncbi:MAG: response regulator [Planctomycetales bacterium]|nr:response regulator [Planctomycetales bacterium]
MPEACLILLVEEDPTLREITAFRLELLGHRIAALPSADAALDWLGEQKPDLIAVGHVSDMPSFELLNRFSDDPRTSESPVLYLSPDSDLDAVQKAFNAGADEYLLVPYDPLVLEDKVSGLAAAVHAKS